jgi:hypothetical protein
MNESTDAKADLPAEDDDAAIGYRRPPRKHQWKPGQSGNPRGRRKGARGFRTDRDHMLELPVQATEDGQRRTLTTQQAALRALRKKALSGDMRALDRVIELALDRQTEVEAEANASAAERVSKEDHALLEQALARLSPTIKPDAP